MKIVLCIKQVPDTSDIKWTENNTIQREGLESIINPYDVYAIEAALKLKRSYDNIKITALTMGPFQAADMLKKTLATGVDEGILLSDRKFAAADTYATGKTIGTAIKEIIAEENLPNIEIKTQAYPDDFIQHGSVEQLESMYLGGIYG